MHDGGQPIDLAMLVEEHYALVYRYACRLSGSACEAEDLTQQAFLTAQRKLDQLREPERAKGWLCAIVRNAYLKELRDGNGHAAVSLDRVAEPADTENAPIDREELQAALNELPEEFRTPLILFYFEEFTYREIAERMETPVGTVMSRLARAKSHLRERLAMREPATAELPPGRTESA
ncbi:MAG: sigma-70 family RNA polymerase sigma factor [Planctomycetaceae bacterium]